MSRLLLLSLLSGLAAGLAAEQAAEPSAAAKAIAAIETRFNALRKEGTGFALRDRYEALLAEASAAAEAHAADPAVARAYRVIARCCEALGKHPEKEAAFARYVDLLMATAKDRAAAELRSEIDALVARREMFAATKLLRLMLAKFTDGPEAAWALYRLGSCTLLMDNFAEASSAFSEVLERWPASPAAAQARLRVVRANVAQAKPADSIPLLEAFLAKDPESPLRDAALFDLAMARYLAQDYYGALVGFQHLVREAPNSPYAPIARAGVAKLRNDILSRLSGAEK